MYTKSLFTIIVSICAVLSVAATAFANGNANIHTSVDVTAESGSQSANVDMQKARTETRVKTVVNGEVVTDIHEVATSGSATTSREDNRGQSASRDSSSMHSSQLPKFTQNNNAEIKTQLASIKTILTGVSQLLIN